MAVSRDGPKRVRRVSEREGGLVDRQIVLVHSSDLHLTHELFVDQTHVDQLFHLRQVLRAAKEVGADALLLAGDIFEHNRQPLSLLDRAARTMAEAGLPIVILPGNHDPLTPDSVYRRGGLSDPPNVHVLGVTADEAVHFPELELEVWGHAHMDYSDMSPLRNPRPRTARRHVAMAHGHFVPEPVEPGRFYGSWVIREEEILATAADYVALGHWNRAVKVSDGVVPAYYSGSPDLARSVNVVRFFPDGRVEVTRQELRPEDEWVGEEG